MKLSHFLLFYVCLASAGLAAAQNTVPASAGSGDSRGGFEQEFPQNFGRDRPDSRDSRDRSDRKDLRDPQNTNANSNSREQMSPEERRQLRRDVNDAGHEIYGRHRR